jgi:hypothetical protein
MAKAVISSAIFANVTDCKLAFELVEVVIGNGILRLVSGTEIQRLVPALLESHCPISTRRIQSQTPLVES